MDFQNLVKVEYSDQRILTTEQIADSYGCKVQQIQQNFLKNKDRFEIGKHYFKLEGEELKAFKSYFDRIELPINKFAPTLYLWTKRGAARHAKMLSTDKAWEVFEALEDNYFNAKEKIETAPKIETPAVVQNQFPKYHEIIEDIDETAKKLEKCFGVKYGIAFADVTSMFEENHGLNLTRIKNLIPPAEHDIGYLTPTQIGELIKKSAQYVNKKLLEIGMQEKDGHGGYILTEKGKCYGEAMPFERHGHTGYQIKWLPEVLQFID